jgi:hypothetical protein
MTPSTPWISWHRALERAGTFEALRPHLHAGRIVARHGGIYYWPNPSKYSEPGIIPPAWWRNASEDTGRVIFAINSYDLFAIDIVLEAEGVERIFPAAIEPTPAATELAPAAIEPTPQPTVTELTPRRQTRRPHPDRVAILQYYRDWLASGKPNAPKETAQWVEKEVKEGRLRRVVHPDTIPKWDRKDREEKGRT